MTSAGMIVPFMISFALGLFFTPLAIGMAVRWKICEKPNGRTCREIAHIGGVAIIGSIVFALIPAFLFILPQNLLTRVFLPILIASGFLTFLLGIIDDLRSLHYIYKLFFQIAVSVFVSAGGVGLLEHFGLTHMSLPTSFIAFGLATLWMLIMTTSFNLIDGLDGLASGIALISASAFVIAGYIFGLEIVVVLSVVLMGAVLAFLRYNFPPAKIFMGDSGSLFLGLIFGLISLLFLIPGQEIFYRICGCVIVLSVPLMDTILAFMRRVLTGRPPFEADHMHLHHILLYRLRSMRKVDLFLWSLSAVFAALGVLTMMSSLYALIVAMLLEISFFGFSLREMVNFDIPLEKIEDLLENCQVSSPAIVPRKD